jgi:hypothetical protein
MLQLILEIWYSIPLAWRRILTAIPLVVGTVIALVNWDWIPLAVGLGVSFVLFVLPDAAESEKKGYRF